MPEHRAHLRLTCPLLTCLLLGPPLLGACTSGETSEVKHGVKVSDFELEQGKDASALHLEAVVDLVSSDEVKDVAALETMINDPEAGLAAVDIDEDGEVDFVEVVEDERGGKLVLVLRAVPSSKVEANKKDIDKIAVEVAVIEVEPHEADDNIVVHATYTKHIHHDAEVHVYHHEHPVKYDNHVVVVSEGHLFHHLFVVEHDHYHGHHAYIVIEGGPKHYKHKKHKKYKHHKHKGGKGKAKGHKKGHGVVVSW